MNAKCQSCGMPLDTPQLLRKGNDGNTYCLYCVNADGELKPFEEILSGTSQYLMESQGLTQLSAEKMARDMLQKMPAWQEKE